MRREDLEHIIRACARVTGDADIVVVGSQAILASYPTAPAALVVSVEADVYPRNLGSTANAIDVNLGELSRFHSTHDVYAHAVGPETAKAPAGWQQRLVPLRNANTAGATGWCMEPHDLVLAKLARGDHKDVQFATVALAYGLVRPDELESRLPGMPVDEQGKAFVASALRSCVVSAAHLPAPGGAHTVPLLAAVSSGRRWVIGHDRAGRSVRGYWRSRY